MKTCEMINSKLQINLMSLCDGVWILGRLLKRGDFLNGQKRELEIVDL